jgi:hypothetical protein
LMLLLVYKIIKEKNKGTKLEISFFLFSWAFLLLQSFKICLASLQMSKSRSIKKGIVTHS